MSDKVTNEEGVTNNYVTNNIKKEALSVDWECVGRITAALAAGAVICSLIWAISAYNINTNEKMAEAIKNGSHPTDVYCAFDGSGEDKVCLVRAAVSGKEAK